VIIVSSVGVRFCQVWPKPARRRTQSWPVVVALPQTAVPTAISRTLVVPTTKVGEMSISWIVPTRPGITPALSQVSPSSSVRKTRVPPLVTTATVSASGAAVIFVAGSAAPAAVSLAVISVQLTP